MLIIKKHCWSSIGNPLFSGNFMILKVFSIVSGQKYGGGVLAVPSVFHPSISTSALYQLRVYTADTSSVNFQSESASRWYQPLRFKPNQHHISALVCSQWNESQGPPESLSHLGGIMRAPPAPPPSISMWNYTHAFISTKIHELLYVLFLLFNCVSIWAVTGLTCLRSLPGPPRPRSKPPTPIHLPPALQLSPSLPSLCRHSFSFILFLAALLIIKPSKLFSLSSRSQHGAWC